MAHADHLYPHNGFIQLVDPHKKTREWRLATDWGEFELPVSVVSVLEKVLAEDGRTGELTSLGRRLDIYATAEGQRSGEDGFTPAEWV